MLSRRLPLAQVFESGVRFSWREAVALTQAAAALGGHPAAAGCDVSLSDCTLDDRGTLSPGAGCRLSVSRSELALLLVRLLPADADSATASVPSGLHSVIARALDMSDDAGLTSIADFARALAAFEDGARHSLLRAIHHRCLIQSSTLASARTGGRHGAETTDKLETERRKSGAGVDGLRRLLRELDEHEYLARARREGGTTGPNVRSTPRRRRPSAIAVSALAAAVLFAAGIGIGEQRMRRNAPPPASVAASGGAGSRDTPRDTATESRMPPDAGTTRPLAAVADARAVSTAPGRQLSTGRTRSAVAPHTVKASGDRIAKPSLRSATPALRSATPATRPAITRARRWAPVRLFSAIGHHLSDAVRRARGDVSDTPTSGEAYR